MSATNPDSRRGSWHRDDPIDPQAVLAALDDDACRDILEATAETALTATELSEECDIPMSTAYRKVEMLTEAELVTEQVRINTSGKHATEYRKNFDDVLISVAGSGVEVELTKPDGEATSYAVADD